MLLSLLTSTAPGNFIQDRVTSTKRPKPPLVSLQKVDGAPERERWAILRLEMSAPRPHSMGWKDHNEVSGAGGRESRAKWNEKWFVHYEEAREHGAASLSVFPATLMEAEKWPILGSINKKWTRGQLELFGGREALGPTLAWTMMTGTQEHTWICQPPPPFPTSLPQSRYNLWI